LARCGIAGRAVEIGSGLGFVKEVIPGMMTTDILPYPDLDGVVDATRMPFGDESLKFIGMLDVFHHIPDVSAFLSEAQRCLRPGGRLLIIDQHPGFIGGPILKYLHHEPFHPETREWAFKSTGPLSDANGALAWIVFRRDFPIFESRFPGLRLISYRPHTPLRYWLSGGLKKWSLLPGWTFPLASRIDRLLLALSPNFGSFVDIEIERLRAGTRKNGS
jgi:SAM-dependent methyltransferase